MNAPIEDALERLAKDDPEVFRYFTEIGILYQLATTLLERALPNGLKISHFAVLNHFARLEGESTPAALARAHQVTKGAMTNTLQKLEARGYINIRPDDSDGRVKKVSITPNGLAARNVALQALAPQFGTLENAFGLDAFRDAMPFMRELRDYLSEIRN